MSGFASDRQSFAQITRPFPRVTLMTSDRCWEMNEIGPVDDVSPDWISEVTTKTMANLLDQAMDAGVALDWPTARVHMKTVRDNVIFTTRVDVLAS